MKIYRLSMFTFALVCVAPCTCLHADVPPEQKPEVEHLITFLETSDCSMIRNGEAHDGEEAAGHVRRKYEHFRNKIDSTEDFIRYDRRRMTAQPPADRQGWLDAMLTFEELSGGQWPTFELTDTLAVRGHRLVANRWTMGLGEAGQVEFVVVTRADEAVDKMEITYFFDPEDMNDALAELDRLHAELESEGQ